MDKFILETKGLVCGYEGFRLKGLDCKISRGKITGVIGPNGSGKTTFLRAITKIIPVISGDIFFDQRRLEKISLKELSQNIAVVSQQDFADQIKVKDYVALGRTPYFKEWQFLEDKSDWLAVEKALIATGADKFADKFISQISSGERQLVLLSRALAQEPKLLILDEPTSHLDIGHQIQVLNLVKKLCQEENFSVILVLHDLNLAGQYCDELVLFKDGAIAAVGSPKQVLSYDIIEKVYKVKVLVAEHPTLKTPWIFPF
jgi:iron complex transport system ATP-binding protein